VRPAVRDELLRVNRAFYQNLALSFAATRPRPQPGVVRALTSIAHEESVLDAGCGHGLAATQLARGGHRGQYLGLDSSERLIEMARKGVLHPWVQFHVADLAEPDWRIRFPAGTDRPFDRLLAFAVLHHLPGDDLRRRVVDDLRSLLSSEGRALVSVWDFRQSARMSRRIVPWDALRLIESDVEPGDALLEWRHEGHGLRYVHHFTSNGLADLARRSGFTVLSEYHSDGEGGRMGLYQVWRA